MREINFRAWDTHNKKWTLPLVATSGWITLIEPFNHRKDTRGNLIKIKLMQYTGLKDKNGKEIYEGDIVKVFTFAGGKFREDKGLEEIHWWNSGFCRGIKDIKGLPLWWLDKDTQKFEIVGNIYENSELLEKQ